MPLSKASSAVPERGKLRTVPGGERTLLALKAGSVEAKGTIAETVVGLKRKVMSRIMTLHLFSELTMRT